MDKDRVECLDAKISGSLKETIGKVTGGNIQLEAESKTQKAEVTTENALSGAKNAVRGAVSKSD